MLTTQEAEALLHAIRVAPEMKVDPVVIIQQVYEAGYKARDLEDALKKERAAEALMDRRRLAYGPFVDTVKVS